VDIVLIYCSLVRSIVRYASVVFADLPAYLSDSLESIQKRALAITWPGTSCSNTLHKAGPVPLSKPQTKACIDFEQKITRVASSTITHQNVIQSNSHYPEPGQVEPSTHQN